MKTSIRRTSIIAAAVAQLALAGAAPILGEESVAASSALVSVGSAPNLVVRNMQAEPAIAVDASRPDVLAAGAIDYIDIQPCVGRVCKGPGRGVGSSGVYFSFDRGRNWVQPTYTGLTERDCSTTACAVRTSARWARCLGTSSPAFAPLGIRPSPSGQGPSTGSSPGRTARACTTRIWPPL